MQDIITNLPISLSCTVLCSWLDFVSLVHVDSAYCVSDKRGLLHDVFRSNECVNSETVELHNRRCLEWISSRGLKSVSIRLEDGVDASMVSRFLRGSGHHVKKVELYPACRLQDAFQIAAHCRHLQHLVVMGNDYFAAVAEMVRCNPQLEEIEMACCSRMDTLLLDSDTCSALKKLTVKSVNDLHSFPWNTFVGGSLERIALHRLSGDAVAECVAALSRCPNLHHFSTIQTHVQDAELITLSESCKNLTDLFLDTNTVVTDAGIEGMLRNLPKLESIGLCNCRLLTAASLRHIGTHSAVLLKQLAVNIGPNDLTELEALLNACPKLVCLDLKADRGMWNATAMRPVFTAVRDLRVLRLGGWFVEDDLLCLVGQCFPKLVRLILMDVVFEMEAAAFALAQGCPNLRILVVDDITCIPVSARPFWQLLRPELRIVLSEDVDRNALHSTIGLLVF